MATHNDAYRKVNTNTFGSTTIDKDKSIGGTLYEMGRPCRLPESSDRDYRISNFLRTKMSVIDLVPCRYALNIKEIVDTSSFDLSGLIPNLIYDEPIYEFQGACLDHGLSKDNKYIGLRMYTTDDTQVTDSISNQLEDNFFQNMANTAQTLMKPVKSFVKTTGMENVTTPGIEAIANKASSGYHMATELLGGDSQLANQIGQMTSGFIQTISDVAINGYRLSFPKIWSDSRYNPSVTCIVKLISPYGHPKAIKKYIIEPLMYLILLGSPKTKDGMSYGRPFTLTLNAYGMSYVPLASVQSISLRRGGQNTAYNVYKQPLSIDVSITFESLTGGFAVWNKGGQVHEDSELAKSADKFINEFGEPKTSKAPTLTTLGHIVRSLRPIATDHEIESHVSLSPNFAYSSSSNQTSEKVDTDNQKSASMNQEQSTHISAKETNAEITKTEERSSYLNRKIDKMLFGRDSNI